MGSPLRDESGYLSPLSIVSKDFFGFMGSKFLNNGVTLLGLDRIEGLSWAELMAAYAVPPPLFNVGTRVLYINHSGKVY